MKIDPSYIIETCASKDETRPTYCHAYYDPSKARIVATDGHRLACVPVQVDPGDTAGYVTADALKAARKVSKRTNGTAEITANGSLYTGAATFPRPADEGRFPPVDSVIPDYRDGSKHTASITFNAELLAGICKAIGAGNRAVTITFRVDDRLQPIVVQAGDDNAIGVLMPMRK